MTTPNPREQAFSQARPAPALLPILVDTREQLPYRFSDLVAPTVATLPAGDYSLPGFETRVALERKSLADYLGSITAGRERFKRELEKLAGYDFAAVVVEASLDDVVEHRYRSMATPGSVLGTTWAITTRYIPVLFAGSRELAERTVEGLLSRFWRDRQQAPEAREAGGAA